MGGAAATVKRSARQSPVDVPVTPRFVPSSPRASFGSARMSIDEAKQELTRIIQDREMKDALLLVFANKQDLSGGAYMPEVVCEGYWLT